MKLIVIFTPLAWIKYTAVQRSRTLLSLKLLGRGDAALIPESNPTKGSFTSHDPQVRPNGNHPSRNSSPRRASPSTSLQKYLQQPRCRPRPSPPLHALQTNGHAAIASVCPESRAEVCGTSSGCERREDRLKIHSTGLDPHRRRVRPRT